MLAHEVIIKLGKRILSQNVLKKVSYDRLIEAIDKKIPLFQDRPKDGIDNNPSDGFNPGSYEELFDL